MDRLSYRSAAQAYLTDGPGRHAPPSVAQTILLLDPDDLGLRGPHSVTDAELEELRLTLERFRTGRAQRAQQYLVPASPVERAMLSACTTDARVGLSVVSARSASRR